MSDDTFTTTKKLHEIEREIAQRRRIYPKLISRGRMAGSAAARQLRILEAVRDDYRKAVEEACS